uniref:Cytochrome c oxidase subunit 2 n=1 Tax=Corchorus olitorius TaxID=93759 RepID=A0A1C9U0C4_9ROSI|nr:cytochrome c oxidase subunit 2 [Corchorus olitorius]AOR16332.1 cytochrome c oxidase subunit 2 [Corchorus olitorius]
MMQGIIDLHHDIFFFLILILVFVLWILVRALWHFQCKKNPIPQRIVHGTTIEIIRTIFPSIIPMFIAIPSFALLYSMDEIVVDPDITIKAIGHQWYRTYEYSDYNNSDEQSLTFDSYTIPEDDLELGQSRLLEVDNRVVVPAKTFLRIILTSSDVPHSWAVPSSGVKCDAVPGRLNQISIFVQREGVYYGQCSEICGTNHAFMPIVVEALSRKDYGNRVSNQLIPQNEDTSILTRCLTSFLTVSYCEESSSGGANSSEVIEPSNQAVSVPQPEPEPEAHAIPLDLNRPAPGLTDEELAQETEMNSLACEKILSEICEEAKTLARNAGVTDLQKLENVELAVKYLSDVQELDEETRLSALHQFKDSLHDNDTWKKIDLECKRWSGGRGLC